MVTKASKQHPINWLEELGKAAKEFKPLLQWDRQFFLLARYPWLRPGYDTRTGSVLGYEKEQKYFRKLVSTWEQSIKRKVPEALKGLPSNQRQQLAALLIDTINDLEEYKRSSSNKMWAKDLLRQGKAWQRRLDRKAAAVHGAVTRWLQEAFTKSSHPIVDAHYNDQDVILTAQNRLRFINHPDILIASKVLALLNTRRNAYPSADGVRLWKDSIVAWKKKNSASMNMVQLYWFFRHECGCPGDDAEVRTALIRNEFWRSFVRPVKYIPKYNGYENKGCNAVRVAIARYC